MDTFFAYGLYLPSLSYVTSSSTTMPGTVQTFEWTFIDETPTGQQVSSLAPMEGAMMLIQAANLEEGEEEAQRGIKRKRTSTACDQCRDAHLSCNGRYYWDLDGGQDCSSCARRGFDCNFTPKTVKKPRR